MQRITGRISLKGPQGIGPGRIYAANGDCPRLTWKNRSAKIGTYGCHFGDEKPVKGALPLPQGVSISGRPRCTRPARRTRVYPMLVAGADNSTIYQWRPVR
jgi:hypothetical protein